MTVGEIIKNIVHSLNDAEIENAEFDAVQIVSAASGIDYRRLSLFKQQELTAAQENKIRKMAGERIDRRPLQYILGEWEFYGLPFYVGEGVLIPRQDTETLVEAALDFLKSGGKKSVVDLCSGSGCIAVSIGKNAPDTEIAAVELYDNAYKFTVQNIGLNKCDNVKAVKRDLFDGPWAEYDLIVSNPPYIPKCDIDGLEPEVGREPITALEGGDDGLIFYRAIAEKWAPALNGGGAIMVECGINQAEAVAALFKNAGLGNIKMINDLCGVPRVVVGYKK